MFQPCSCVQVEVPVKLHGDMSVGDLVAKSPQYALTFKKHQIDFCCGGKLTLRQVCAEKDINLAELIAKLMERERDKQGCGQDWTKASLKELTEHIIETYHVPLREQLTFIEQLAQKVARVHGQSHPEMVTLLNEFTGFKSQLELHMQKEEVVLFPSIVKLEAGESLRFFGCGGGIDHPISVMLQEHDDAGKALESMRSIANNYIAPPDACNSFRLLLTMLETLETEMHWHVHKENNILFPRSLELMKPTVGCV